MAVIEGTEGDDSGISALEGTEGNDQVFGDGGNDQIFGNGGDDLLNGGWGADLINGGAGIDVVVYDGQDPVTVDLAAGTGSRGEAEGDRLLNIENIIAPAGDDTLLGSDIANTLSGNDGNDTLEGRGGNDTLLGGGGDDFLRGGAGADHLDGGAGNNVAEYLDDTAGVTVDLAAGTGHGGEAEGDTLTSIEHVNGGHGNDVLIGSAGANNLYGGDGDDVLRGGAGADILIGADGTDTASYFTGSIGVLVNLAADAGPAGGAGAGHGGDAEGDLLYTIENVSGSQGNDTLLGDAGANTLQGWNGDDFLSGGAGADHLDGGAGNDTIDYNGTAAVTVDLAGGWGSGGEAEGDVIANVENVRGTAGFGDLLFGSAAGNILMGFDGNDGLFGRDGNDKLYGGDGIDNLDGGAGADLLDGGDGFDTVEYNGAIGVVIDLAAGTGHGGEAEGDTLISIEDVQGTGFADTLYGSAANDVLSAYGGNDHLTGRDGDDALLGGAGDDILNGGAGADKLEGGDGIDTVVYGGTIGVLVVMDGGQSSNGEAAGDLLLDIENVQGTAFDDTINGSDVANVLSGNDGNDFLVGGGGNDTLVGGNGGDNLEGGAGADHLDGGAGNDVVLYTGSTAVTVDLAAGTGHGGDAEGDTLVGIENATGTIFNDTLIGTAGANFLDGAWGDDVLRGGAGADSLVGEFGTDTASYFTSSVGVTVDLGAGTGHGGDAEGDILVSIEIVSGSQGNDSLRGDSNANGLQGWNGNDVLNGVGGQDTLTGGAGVDRFVFTAIGDSTVAAGDRITDFSDAQADRIDLSAIDANTGVAGDQAFHFLGTGAYTHHAGELRFAVNGADTIIAGDVNGDGTSDFHITLTGHVTLTAGDFVL